MEPQSLARGIAAFHSPLAFRRIASTPAFKRLRLSRSRDRTRPFWGAAKVSNRPSPLRSPIPYWTRRTIDWGSTLALACLMATSVHCLLSQERGVGARWRRVAPAPHLTKVPFQPEQSARLRLDCQAPDAHENASDRLLNHLAGFSAKAAPTFSVTSAGVVRAWPRSI